MLPKPNRLNLSREYYKIKKGNLFIQTPIFKVFYAESGDVQPKIGFVVSHHIGKAVVRNRVRRLLAEEVRKNLSKFPKKMKLVFIAKHNIISLKHGEISTFINQVLSKIPEPK